MDSVIRCVHCGKLMTDPVAEKRGTGSADEAAEADAGAGAVTATVTATAGAESDAGPSAPGATPTAAPGTAAAPTSGVTPMGVQASQAAVTSHNQLPQQQQQKQSKQEPYFVMKAQPTNVPPGMPTPSGGYVGSESNVSATLAVWLTIASGLLLAAGIFLPWGEVALPGTTVTIQGQEFPIPDVEVVYKAWEHGLQGWLIIGAGLGLGALCLAAISKDIDKLKGALFEGIFIAAMAAWAWVAGVSPSARFDNEMSAGATELSGLGADGVQKVMDYAEKNLVASVGMGFWIVVAAAFVATLAGIFAFLGSGPRVTAIAPGGANWVGSAPPPPPSPTGR